MDEIIEGGFKLFFGILFFLCAPVIALIYAGYGVRWVWRRFDIWWAIHGDQAIYFTVAGMVVVVVGIIGSVLLYRWWRLHEERAQRASAQRQLDRKYQQTAAAIQKAGAIKPVVPSVVVSDQPNRRGRTGRQAL